MNVPTNKVMRKQKAEIGSKHLWLQSHILNSEQRRLSKMFRRWVLLPFLKAAAWHHKELVLPVGKYLPMLQLSLSQKTLVKGALKQSKIKVWWRSNICDPFLVASKVSYFCIAATVVWIFLHRILIMGLCFVLIWIV